MKTIKKLAVAAVAAMLLVAAFRAPPRSVVVDSAEQDAAASAIDELKFRAARGRPRLVSWNMSAASDAAASAVTRETAPRTIDLAAVKRRGLGGEHPHVVCDTSEGRMVLEVRFDWSPIGAERFVALVDDGWFLNNVFYRVTPINEMAIAQVRVVCTPPTHTHRRVPAPATIC